MSKHDTHFFNVFSVVLGLLVAFAILVFALARYVGKHEQNASQLNDPLLQQAVAERVAGPARVALAGQDNTALVIAPVSTASTTAAAAVFENGEQVYETACKACHGGAIQQAPRAGDKAAWAPRVAQGKNTLYEHAIKGFTGKSGMAMPAKGGRPDISDELIKQAVDVMVGM